MGRVFGLHERAVEDAVHADQRPKLEQYGDSLFCGALDARLIRSRSFAEGVLEEIAAELYDALVVELTRDVSGMGRIGP